MSSKEFLKELVEEGKRLSGGGGAGIVGRVKVEFGFHRYVNGHNFWSFWKPANAKTEMKSVKNELVGRLQQAGCGDAPSFGIKITIDKNVLSRPEPYKADLQEFIPDWQEDAFNLVFDYIDQSDLPLGEWFYGKVEYKANPFHVKQGEAGKKDRDQNGNPRFPTIRVPVEKFADEAAAKATVGGASGNTASNSQWSERAVASYGPDMGALEKQTDEILKWLDEAKKGNPFNNDAENFPLPTPPTPPNLKKYVAEIYAIESTDIDLLIPF